MTTRTKGTDLVRGSSWRHLVATRVLQDRGELIHVPDSEQTREKRAHVERLLETSDMVAKQVPGWKHPLASVTGWWEGESDQAWLSLHEAEALIDELLPERERIAHARDLLTKADRVLPEQDRRVRVVADVFDRWRTNDIPPAGPALDPVAVAHLARAVNGVSDERYAQSRSFRNRLIRMTVLSLAMLGLVLLVLWQAQVPIGGSDVIELGPGSLALLVALFGAVGALITSVPPLARVAGTWNPFSLPLYQMLLKIVLGPTFALVGVMMLESDMIPGVTTADLTLTQLMIWALVFGAAQHLVTRVVDNRVAGLVSSDPAERAEASEQTKSSGSVRSTTTQ